MLALALLLFTAFGPAQDVKPIPADLAQEVQRSERIGRTLFESDQASWHASDALAESKGPLEKLGLGGFLALKERDSSWTVLFLSSEERPRILQRVQVQGPERKPKLLDTPTPLPLSKEDAPLWAARQLALESGGPYEQPINPVVLRGSDFGESGILVYLLGGSDKPDVAVLGRHVRVRVSDDGAKVTELLPLVKGIIESPTKSGEGKPVVGEVPTDHYPVGSVAAAKTGNDPPGTFDSQFFIVTGKAQGASLPNDYARFGAVKSGMDVVNKIGNLPTDANGEPNSDATIDTVTISGG